MTVDTCERHSSRLAQNPPDPEVSAHLSHCEECSRARETLLALKAHGTLLPPGNPALRNRILQSARPIGNVPVFHRPAGQFWAFITLIFLVLGGSRLFLNISTSPGKTFQISENGHPFLTRELSHPLVSASGPAVILAPDQSRFDVAGDARLTVLPRGLSIIRGFVRIKVQPQSEVFWAITPHGRIEVTGTEFSCSVQSQDTRIEMFSGRVVVHPATGTAFPLIAGQRGNMLYSLHRDHTPPGEDNARTNLLASGSSLLPPLSNNGTTTYSPEQE